MNNNKFKERVDKTINILKSIYDDLASNWKYSFQPFHLTENIIKKGQANHRQIIFNNKRITIYDHTYGCPSLCSYCGYFTVYPPPSYSVLLRQLLLKQREINILIANGLNKSLISALYFGGGTPTILPNDLLDKLISFYHDNLRIDKKAEITVEANPQTLTRDKFNLLRSLGVNRLSIGIQSLNESILKDCGRNYLPIKACLALEEAVKFFSYVNADVIYGLKNQKLNDHLDTLKQIVELGVNQITAYSLWLKGDSKVVTDYISSNLGDYPTVLEKLEMYLYTKYFLESVGYKETFIGWFSKEGDKVKIYDQRWVQSVPCVGIGCGAYSYGHNYHYNNYDNWQDYNAALEEFRAPVKEVYDFSDSQELKARLMWKIKSGGPFNLDNYEIPYMMNLIAESLVIKLSEGVYQVSDAGRAVSEFIISELII